jgi:hypothetical protein
VHAHDGVGGQPEALDRGATRAAARAGRVSMAHRRARRVSGSGDGVALARRGTSAHARGAARARARCRPAPSSQRAIRARDRSTATPGRWWSSRRTSTPIACRRFASRARRSIAVSVSRVVSKRWPRTASATACATWKRTGTRPERTKLSRGATGFDSYGNGGPDGDRPVRDDKSSGGSSRAATSDACVRMSGFTAPSISAPVTVPWQPAQRPSKSSRRKP